MDNKSYREVMVETLLVETLNNNVARFDHLLSSGLSLQDMVMVSRAMRLLVDKALEQSVQKVIDIAEPMPPPPTHGFPFDPSMN